jgi:hypothetical protein
VTLYRPIEIAANSGDLPVVDQSMSALEYELEKISQLWCEVIRVSVFDVMHGRYDAINWLYSPDFYTVCHMANINDAETLRAGIINLRRAKRRRTP